jgi:hypothetical protein
VRTRATDGGERHIEGSLFADSTAHQSGFSRDERIDDGFAFSPVVARVLLERNPYSRVTLVVYARTVDTAAFSRHDNAPRLFRLTRRAR